MTTPEAVVLITGCSSGIGQSLARAFHRHGHAVCATARDVASLEELRRQGMMVHALDITSRNSIDALLSSLRAADRYVGTLVNNAGQGVMGPMLDIRDDEWRRQFEVNLFAPMALARLTVPGMIARGHGLVINISSVSGVMATPFAGPYCASKAALNAASDALRMELEPFGVRVITVQPGGIQSSFGSRAANGVSLANDSVYQPVKDGVLMRATESQAGAMPSDEFAEALVRKIADRQGPSVIRLGRKSSTMPLMKSLLPTTWLDRLLQRRFRLDSLRNARTIQP